MDQWQLDLRTHAAALGSDQAIRHVLRELFDFSGLEVAASGPDFRMGMARCIGADFACKN